MKITNEGLTGRCIEIEGCFPDPAVDRVIVENAATSLQYFRIASAYTDANGRYILSNSKRYVLKQDGDTIVLAEKLNTEQNLNDAPIPVAVDNLNDSLNTADLNSENSGKPGYTVYRYHDGAVEKISSASSIIGEYFTISRGTGASGTDQIILYVKKFSTYVIAENVISIADNESADMDVQAKITDNSIGVYKVDISWGAMTFEWDAAGEVYNPDTHTWTQISGGGEWTAASHDGINNKITCANHSNGSLLVAFAVTGTLGGVTYEVLQDNGSAAVDMPLSKVPAESSDAPEINAFLKLSNEPADVATVLDNTWKKSALLQ